MLSRRGHTGASSSSAISEGAQGGSTAGCTRPSHHSIYLIYPDYNEHVRKAGQWLVRRLRKAGLENAQMLRTNGLPAVFAQWTMAPAGAPTVLIYGHYDVQPIYVHHFVQWTHKPFEPAIEDGDFIGRVRNINLASQAVEAFLQTGGLPVHVKFLFEAEEETGSENLAQLISESQGGIPVSMRGRVSFEIEAETATHDAHSGFVGGSVPNALHVLVGMVSSLHLPNSSIAVEGFYDGVREIDEEDRRDVSVFPFNEESEAVRLGLEAHHGEEGYSTLERRWLRPSLDIVGLAGGHGGEGTRGVVTSKAKAKVMCRLVADQNATAVLESLERHISAHTPRHARISFRPIAAQGRLVTEPYRMPKDTLGNRAAAKVLEEVMGSKPLRYMEGHSGARFNYFREYLGIFTTQFGFGTPDYQAQSEMDGAFRNDERLPLSSFHKGRRAWAMLLHEIAEQSGTPASDVSSCSVHAEAHADVQ
ncbi:g2774 [Coccomyxa elongata]